MGTWKMHSDEKMLVVGRPAVSAVWLKYLLTAGLYGFWHKRHVVALTDHRLLLGKGILSRQEQSIPLSHLKGASYRRKGLSAFCDVYTANGYSSTHRTRIGPLTSRIARRFVDEVETRS